MYLLVVFKAIHILHWDVEKNIVSANRTTRTTPATAAAAAVAVAMKTHWIPFGDGGGIDLIEPSLVAKFVYTRTFARVHTKTESYIQQFFTLSLESESVDVHDWMQTP